MMKKWFIHSQALLGMLLVQLFATGMQILSRVILIQGAYIFSLIMYRHIVGAICVAPFAIYFERGQAKKFNWRVCFWVFANALAGMTLSLALFYYGVRDTSATYAVNFLNLIPISTFLASIIFRMESLRIGTWGGRAKGLGTLICVAGAIITSLYKGKVFYIGHHSNHAQMIIVAAPQINMLRGTFFLVGSCCSYTTWFIMQVKLAEVFPLRYWRTFLSCVMAALQSAVIGACFNYSKEAWRLEWNLQLITIIYSGALATAATFCLISWAVTIKGPTYPSMFNPLALVFVALSEAILLGEPLHVGQLLGMVLIILGIYSFLWGKKNEMHLPQEISAAAGPSYSPDESVLEIDI
ncbi:WAT1-related protein At1g09380-like [Vicia villosa]|uniref:WAT1-related protein At1g09380-like n=1 Tax=Vicia villosa TaxID=3911 RepID=UPI00273BB458|nr:WAT1-related protein At1g09380-like [Vicia villosa]XP_058729350.1 WAT1-related protein At1g09380-like [Vicia villosa]XP_058729351.1 WAT1-related protein At1g09380-like [Vicia villosa]XP_058729352.1 WAT1-related protein At1g09380-like [Vicia villosa]XP_058729353.1 WAT1-related protein At1g09380-like [Vicia villosa]